MEDVTLEKPTNGSFAGESQTGAGHALNAAESGQMATDK